MRITAVRWVEAAGTSPGAAIGRSWLDRLLNQPLFTLAHTQVTAVTLLVVAAILAATFWVGRLSRLGTTRAFNLRGHADAGTVGVTARLVQYGIWAVGLAIAAQTLGVDLGALFTAGAFFAIALGFAMQNVAQNFVAGIILLTERTIKPGDVLEVESRVVRVTHMGLRATVARSRDEEDLIIPNAILVQNTVTNYTLRDALYRLRASVGVSYESDLHVVKQVLLDAANASRWRTREHEPRVLLTAFGDSAVQFEVSIWVQDPWDARITRSDLLEAIWWGCAGAHITIAYPQLDVHIDRRLPPSVRPGAEPSIRES